MEIDTYLSEESEAGRFSGSVLVTWGGEEALKRSYGDADRERGIPNTPRTEFQIASVSKQFTAAAILLLQERGALSVEDRLCRWVPGCPEAWEPITIHQLLTHTSGIGHWPDFPDLSLFDPTTLENLIETFRRGPLKFVPGTGYSYSSPAYVLLADIVQQVSGQPYAAFLQEHIFTPLGMESTAAGNRAPDPGRQAAGYESRERATCFELDVVGMGAGDIWSTVEDLALWDAAVGKPGLLSKTSLHAMFTAHAATGDSLPDGSETRYGYGWELAEPAGRQVIFHTGDNAGFRAINMRFPDEDASAVLLSNEHTTDLKTISMRLVDEMA